MTRTKEVRLAIEALLAARTASLSAAARSEINALVTQMKRHDSRPFTEVLEMLALATPVHAAKPKIDLAETVRILRGVLMDDGGFARAVRDLGANRSATKAFLTQVYLALFQRTRGVRAGAPREEIVQLILDERNVLRRHGTLEALARIETVAAE